MPSAADNSFLAGVHVAKTAGSTLSEHAKAHLGEPAFYRYCRFSRTKRFWSDTPQYEELPEQEKSRIRLIYGHGVSLDVVSLQERIPEFLIAIRHPVPFFHSRYNHESMGAGRRLTQLPFESFLNKEKHNHFSGFLITFFGRLAEFGDEISYRNSVSILRNFKYIFATEHLDGQSLALWNALELPSEMVRRRVAKDKAPLPISDDEILAMHRTDLELYKEIASMRFEDVDRYGALNPFGYEPDRYFNNVAAMRGSSHLNREAHITVAYRELVNQLFWEFDLEAALERMRQPAPHVDYPRLLRELMAHKYKEFNDRYNDKQRELSRRNAESFRTDRAVG